MKKYRKTPHIISPFLLIFFLLLPIYHVDAQYSPYVFKITSEGCPEKGKTQQTGFIISKPVQNKSGIITTLHGVVGQTSINAIDFQRGDSLHNLKIIAVDIGHDIAFLSSNELQQRQGGLDPPRQQTSYTGIRCIGYPFNTTNQTLRKHLSIHSSPEELSNFVPDDVNVWLE
ncbi:MAG: hypothetical protein D3904_09870, partial [Candidatus Electrothrix sp. EH2]|nr:hypothetical protein [Candidatus Electrothrix sp. EH2]